MRLTRVRFPNRDGDELAGWLDLPAGATPRAYGLFAHCFTCGKDLKAARQISAALTESGLALLRFDFTGLGDSEGDFANTNFSSNIDDLVAAADYLRTHHAAPQLLIGHSLGGAAVIRAATRIAECRAVATINAPSDPRHVKRLLSSCDDELTQNGEARVQIAGRSFKIKKQLLDDLDESRLDRDLEALGRPLLVFHAPRDQTVGIDHASKIFSAARHPKSFISLDEADHLLGREPDARFVGQMLATWVRPYLTSLQQDEAPELTGKTVAVRTEDGYRTEVRTSRHELVLDEPHQLGGTDLGPTPAEALLAALGACTSITLKMYAKRKSLPLEAVSVRLSQRRVDAKDCPDCGVEEGQINLIEREIELVGAELTATQRARMLEIADRCPVHRTLHGPTQVRTVAQEGGT
jgi:uncharacterized OsmC-like protein/pimeloyl-ACP methyl ester carboxylesterase